jgi:hypothetical protein
MPTKPLTDDAQLFTLMSELLEQASADEQERRGEPRRPFDCDQLIAPYDGQRLPGAAEFFHARCCDLSPRGFSFCTDEPPTNHYVIAALGRVPFTYVTAEVLRVEALEPGAHMGYRIGCRFVGRLGDRTPSSVSESSAQR